MNATEVCKKIWSKIDNPRSGCPDVGINYVLNIMSSILAEEMDPQLSYVERFILGLLSIRDTALVEFTLFWTESVHHTNDDGTRRSQESIEAEEAKAYREMSEAISTLLNKKLIFKNSENILRSQP